MPTPPSSVRGVAPAGADEGAIHQVADALTSRLAAGNLPGPPAMRAMAIAERAFVDREAALAAGCREASAAVLLYPAGTRQEGWAAEWQVVLTRRGDQLRDHAGQVSFPGGRLEAGESHPAGALRELREELAVPSAALRVLGELSGLYIPPSHFWVYPVVLIAAAKPSFEAQPDEVGAVIEAPVARLLDPAARRRERRDLRGERRWVPYFDLAGHKVWGATAMILAELAALWSDAGPLGVDTPDHGGR